MPVIAILHFGVPSKREAFHHEVRDLLAGVEADFPHRCGSDFHNGMDTAKEVLKAKQEDPLNRSRIVCAVYVKGQELRVKEQVTIQEKKGGKRSGEWLEK